MQRVENTFEEQFTHYLKNIPVQQCHSVSFLTPAPDMFKNPEHDLQANDE